MKGQKLDEAKAGVNPENFGGIPYEEEEYYKYRNWLEKYLIDHPNEAGLSEDDLLAKFRLLNRGINVKPGSTDAIPGDSFEGPVNLYTEDL